MDLPEQVVNNFIIAYKAWNDKAYKLDDKDEDHAMAWAEEAYTNMIRQFCDDSVVPQGISFGSDSSHSPSEETIVEVIEDDANLITIKTKHVDETNFTSDYEYILGRENGIWLLNSLLYVDNDGKYECL